jgi:hypothetical protein
LLHLAQSLYRRSMARARREAVARRVRHIGMLGSPRGAVVHVGHHKVGTLWWGNILRSFAGHYALRFVELPDAQDRSADVYLFRHGRDFERARFAGRPFRGTHMIRDPRDVLVSGYFYHLWTEEAWANQPRDRYGGRTYREELNRRGRHDGLLLEMEYVCRRDQLRDMLSWDYSQPEFLELKYEDVIADESGSFDRAFRHYGFRDREVRAALDIVENVSFSRVSGRKVGEIGAATHLRSGRPGEWREHFTADHLARWQELAGDALTRLGYDSP